MIKEFFIITKKLIRAFLLISIFLLQRLLNFCIWLEQTKYLRKKEQINKTKPIEGT